MNNTFVTDRTSAVVCQRFVVAGMTCSHCEHAIVAEVEQLPGIVAVAADAVAGTVTIESTRELDRGEISAAVIEAGYELVP
jgi:copper chaperone CopZ